MLWAVYLLYFVFEQFIRPLFWALICGIFLHPLKQRAIARTQQWLQYLIRTNTPLLLGIILLPLRVFSLTEELVKQKYGRFFLFAFFIGTLIKLEEVKKIIIHCTLFFYHAAEICAWFVQMTMKMLYDTLTYLYPLLLAYLVTVIACWRYGNTWILRSATGLLWILCTGSSFPLMIEHFGFSMFCLILGSFVSLCLLGIFNSSLDWHKLLRQQQDNEQDICEERENQHEKEHNTDSEGTSSNKPIQPTSKLHTILPFYFLYFTDCNLSHQ